MVKEKRSENSTTYHDAYITQDYAKAIQQERRTLMKAMKKARALGFDSKVIDRHLVVGGERYTCGTIPEHLKESPMKTEITTQVNFCLLELCFNPKALFLVFLLKCSIYSYLYQQKEHCRVLYTWITLNSLSRAEFAYTG